MDSHFFNFFPHFCFVGWIRKQDNIRPILQKKFWSDDFLSRARNESATASWIDVDDRSDEAARLNHIEEIDPTPAGAPSDRAPTRLLDLYELLFPERDFAAKPIGKREHIFQSGFHF